MKVVPLYSFPYKGAQFVENTPVEVLRSNGLELIRKGRVRLWTDPLPATPPLTSTVTIPTPSPLAPPTDIYGFPDLRPHFKYSVWRVMPHSKGVPVGSDFSDKPVSDPVFGVYKNCGFWTVEEAKILFSVARSVGGYWLDIGGLTGWTAAHLVIAGCYVASLDPMYSVPGFRSRAAENLKACGCFHQTGLWTGTSSELFSRTTRRFSGIVIDGDHSTPHPLQDAISASTRVIPSGFILLHDADKPEAQEAYKRLAKSGWSIRLYNTSHGVALCHQGVSLPPELR